MVYVRPFRAAPPIEWIVAAVGARPAPAILDSAGDARGRWTILACEPVAIASWPPLVGDPFEGMRGRVRELEHALGDTAPDDLPFCGGWIGYYGYEAGRYIERLPATTRPDIPLPVARFALYDSAAIHDAESGDWTLAAAELPESRLPAADRLDRWERLLETTRPGTPGPGSGPSGSDRPVHNMSRDRYLDMVRRAKEYIAAGDIFQVNLARRESYSCCEPLLATYLRLRAANPAAYSAFLAWDDTAILSASPELFLELRGREAVTRPIKGTRPRSDDPMLDAAFRAELLASDKDRAELAMIVDLERNDLGRVCEFGSVGVAPRSERTPSRQDGADVHYTLETHPTVHHLVATVRGQLRRDCDAIDLLRACFPGGSITGAPKVRAMEIIDELEPTARSVYTGSIGCFGPSGMTFNIAIRTIIAADGWLHLHAGGGIVADSDPENEYEETCAKALGMRRAICGTAETSTLHFDKTPR